MKIKTSSLVIFVCMVLDGNILEKELSKFDYDVLVPIAGLIVLGLIAFSYLSLKFFKIRN